MRPRQPIVVVKGSALIVATVGAIVLFGWFADIDVLKSVLSGYATMKANAAAAFLLGGTCLWLSAAPHNSPRQETAVRLLATAVAAIGGITVVEYATHIDLGIDQLLLADPDPMSAPYPGRMSLPSAAGFVLFGAAMALPRRPSPSFDIAFGALCVLGVIGSLLALLGYAYGIPELHRPVPYTSIAVHTAATFVAAFAGAITTRPDVPLVALLLSPGTGGGIARRLLPTVILLPATLGWIVLEYHEAGHIEDASTIGLFAAASAGVLSIIVWWSSRNADRLQAEQARTQAALRASEARFLDFVQNAPFVTYIKDREGHYVFHNSESERIYDTPDAAMRGKTAHDFHDPEVAAAIDAAEQRVLATGQPVTFQRHSSTSGEYQWAEVIKFPIRDPLGHITGIGGFDIDITARKRQEDELRNREALHRTILESALDAFILMDEDGVIREWNPQAERMFGWSRAEAVGRRLAETVIPPPQRPAHETGLSRFIATGEGPVLRQRIEVDALRRDGSKFPVELIIMPVRLDDRWIFSGFVRDITERKRSETALRESEDRLRASEAHYRRVVELIQEAIWIHCEGKLVYANPAAAKLFGFEAPEQLIGQAAMSLVHPDDRDYAIARTRVLLEGRSVPVTEMRLLGAEGRVRTVAIQAVPFIRDGKIHVMASARDVTEQREVETQLQQAMKMEAVGQLTGGIAHDFNNLLTILVGSLELALERTHDDRRRLLESALGAAERGATLVHRLLAFSRRQTLQPKQLNLNDLATDMEEMLRRTLGEQIKIQLKRDPALWPALADRGQVENALLNLAINARDAMPRGGKLTIETGNVHLDEAYAARNAEVSVGDYVMVAVTDTGVGMPPEVVERAVEPFFTTKEVGKGSGLGLSMIYGFAKQSRGHLKIYSEVGHGTTVRVYLPRMAERDVAPAAENAGSDHPRGGEIVLVVEDDADVRRHVVSQVKDLGYRVIEAADGPQALRLLDDGAPVDLLFTDVVMPEGMTGRQLADAAILRRPNLKIVFTSGYTENAIVHQGKLDPGVHFLVKPYRRQDLARKLREALDATSQDPGRCYSARR